MLRRARIKHRKENHHARNRHRAIQRRAQHEIVLAPPRPRAPFDHHPEHQPHNRPAPVIRPRRRRDVVQSAQEQRDVHVPPQSARAPPLQQPHPDGQDAAEQEEVDQAVVGGARREEAARADGAPDDVGVEVGAREGAREAVGGGGGADVWDVIEGPVDDADLAEGGDGEADELDEEERACGDLGDVSELGCWRGGWRTLQ